MCILGVSTAWQVPIALTPIACMNGVSLKFVHTLQLWLYCSWTTGTLQEDPRVCARKSDWVLYLHATFVNR
jgi:hypothetical protein